jgi:hypothetical protein
MTSGNDYSLAADAEIEGFLTNNPSRPKHRLFDQRMGSWSQSLKIFRRRVRRELQDAVLLSRMGMWLGFLTKVERWHRMARVVCLRACPTKRRRSVRVAGCHVCDLPNAIK